MVRVAWVGLGGSISQVPPRRGRYDARVRSRLHLTATLFALLVVPVGALVASGLVQVRACVPAAPTLLGSHLTFLRPVAACPSGVALDDGALAVVGTVALATVLAWLTGGGVLAALGLALSRCAALVARLLDAVVPGRRAPGAGPLPSAAPSRLDVVAPTVRTPRHVILAVVGWRGPPLPA